jgi:hypothetical protein
MTEYTREPIVTYGEDNSIGKELLRRYRRQTLYTCNICRLTYEPARVHGLPVPDTGECIDCKADPDLPVWR